MAKRESSTVWGIDRNVLVQMVAGGGSGVASKTAIAPLERVKILMQIQGMHHEDTKYKGITRTLGIIVKEEGWMALFKGNFANVIRVIPNYAIKFTMNDSIKEIVRRPGQTSRDFTFGQMMLSGTLAGVTQICLTYPLEVVRTRLTLSSSQVIGDPYRGIWDCAKRSVKTEGVTSLYKGIGATFLSGAPYTGLTMTFYELFKRLFPIDADGSTGHAYKLWSGAFAGLVAQTVTYPGDTIRRRMQTNGMSGSERVYTNTWDACKKIMRNEGWRAFFKGMTANTVRCVPGAAIQFATYDIIKEFFEK